MKHFLFVLLIISISTTRLAQGLTRYGQITTGTSNDFVDKYGRLGSIPMLDANGKVLFDLTTTAVSLITDNTASCGGNVFSVDALTARGVCWSTSPNPPASGSHTDDGTSTGVYTSAITGLTGSTTYHVRAYATNSYGTGYGNEISFTTGILVPTVTSLTGRIWMDRNLGASRVATSQNDYLSYGDLYQWGRGTDGHQLITSATTTTLSSADVPGHGSFIIITPNTPPNDWRSPQNDNLWQGVNGVNNPCPPGFRLPTDEELLAERNSWSSNDAAGAFSSPLKLPCGGLRNYRGVRENMNFFGCYWSGTKIIGSTQSGALAFFFNNSYIIYDFRAMGYSVRCIKD